MNLKRFARACGISRVLAVLVFTVFLSTVIPAYAATAATITSPTPGIQLSSSTASFTWNAGSGIQRYRFQVGKSWASHEFYNAITYSRSATVKNLPTDGSTLYVQLFSQAYGGNWIVRRYTYTAYKQPVATPVPATMSSPVPGSTLSGTSTTFSWSTGTSVSQYALSVGSSAGAADIYNANLGLYRTATVSNIPQDGRTLYVSLKSLISGVWQTNSYTYKAPTVTSNPGVAATMSTPTPGATLSGTSTAFSWSAGSGVSQYSLTVGSTEGASDLYSANTGLVTNATVGNIPQDGRTLYVSLGSLISGTWKYNAYTYIAPKAVSETSACSAMSLGQVASLNGFRPFPASNAWNQDVSGAAVDPNSATIINTIGSTVGLHADFGAGTWNGAKIGIPYVVVDSTQPKKNVVITTYPAESDHSPMPIPATAPIEGYPNDGDRHVIVLDKSNCWEYDLFYASYNNGTWNAAGSAVWDLQNYESRPYTWSSADASGLPIFPGLVRYDEVAAGAINHAIRVTVRSTKPAFVLPATHWASTNTSSPIPMGTRLRLKTSYDISRFSAANQVILNAMKKYGLLVVDNGSPMFFSGTPDDRWNNDDLHALGSVPASAFEVVQLGTQYSSANIPQGSAPTIGALSASAMTVPAGAAVTLTWTATGASYYYVSPEAGPVRGNSVTVKPTQTTTYVLTATNAFGRTTASITINVQ